MTVFRLPRHWTGASTQRPSAELLGWWIVTCAGEWMAPQQPYSGQQAASQRPVLLNRLQCVFRARGNESAGVRQHRRDESLIHCLLYTSDAADEEDSVDLGGR